MRTIWDLLTSVGRDIQARIPLVPHTPSWSSERLADLGDGLPWIGQHAWPSLHRRAQAPHQHARGAGPQRLA